MVDWRRSWWKRDKAEVGVDSNSVCVGSAVEAVVVKDGDVIVG